MWWKVGKSWEKVAKVAKSGESWEKWLTVGKIGKKLEKVVKSGKNGEKWWKVGKSGKIFSQNGRRQPFWMTENHFRSQFSPFQINTQLFFFFKMAASGHFGSRFFPKSIGTYLYSRSVATSNMKLIGVFLIKLWSAQAFLSYFHKMAAGGHFVFFRFVNISLCGLWHSSDLDHHLV